MKNKIPLIICISCAIICFIAITAACMTVTIPWFNLRIYSIIIALISGVISLAAFFVNVFKEY